MMSERQRLMAARVHGSGCNVNAGDARVSAGRYAWFCRAAHERGSAQIAEPNHHWGDTVRGHDANRLHRFGGAVARSSVSRARAWDLDRQPFG